MKHFDLERVHKGGAKFDPDKTKWFNQQYLRMRPDAELGAQLQAKLRRTASTPPWSVPRPHAVLLKERATFVDDMLEGTYLFTSGSPLVGNAEADAELKKRWRPEATPALEDVHRALGVLDKWTPADLEATFNDAAGHRHQDRPGDAAVRVCSWRAECRALACSM
jgi:glutamyl-tRNA synthetase